VYQFGHTNDSGVSPKVHFDEDNGAVLGTLLLSVNNQMTSTTEDFKTPMPDGSTVMIMMSYAGG